MRQYRKDGTLTPEFIRYMQAKYNEHKKSKKYSLYDCYENPSIAKQSVFHSIQQIADTPIKILSYNTFGFTCSYTQFDDDYFEWFVVDTPHHRYVILLDLLEI
jgi:hypothetical protein